MTVGKRQALLIGAVPAAIAALAATRTWLSGRSADTVLSNSVLTLGGTAAAPAVLPLALVALAAIVAVLTVGRVARMISLVLLLLASLGMVASALAVISDPAGPLRTKAASEAGRIGSAEVTGVSVGPWPWVALVAGLALCAGSILIWRAQRRWSGLSAKYEVPGNSGTGADRAAGADTAGGSGKGTWAALDEGIDPTLETGPTEPDRGGS